MGSFAANAFGLHDMHGNLWELVEDCWHRNYKKGAPTDGSARGGHCEMRVMRGGCWRDHPVALRSAFRERIPPAASNNGVGFRIVQDISP